MSTTEQTGRAPELSHVIDDRVDVIAVFESSGDDSAATCWIQSDKYHELEGKR